MPMKRTIIAAVGLAGILLTQPATAEMIYRRGTAAAPDTLDPTKSEIQPAAFIIYDLFEGLFTLDAKGGRRNGVAASYELSTDGKIYTFKLRADAKWSDGSPVTAADFVYAWRRLANPKTASPYGYFVWPMVNGQEITSGKKPPESLGVEALDDHTLKVTLTKPTGYFLASLQHVALFPLHRASLEKYGESFTAPGHLVSNGAYMLAENVPQSHIKEVKNPYYYDAAKVKIDTVFSYPIDNQETEFKKFRAGELDSTSTLPNAQIKWAQENLKDAYIAGPTYSTYYLSFNLTHEPWKSNPKLRAALALAIDREVIAEKVIGGGELPAWSFTPPGNVGGYEPPRLPWTKQTQAERDAMARKLLAEAGYGPGGKPLPEVEVLHYTSDNARKVNVAVAAMWKQKLGVQTNLNNQEFRVVANIGNEKAYKDVLYYAWIGDYPDANSFLQLFRSDVEQQNLPGYKSADYDRLLDEANIQSDPAKRAELLAKAETLALESNSIITLHHNTRRRLVSPKLKGWVPNPTDFNLSQYLELTP
ncbi:MULTISPECIES: peptide ABC transporter substrate-binding protein [unclassified Azospirillum]|uniref:peptide ABC transporter substrate-binding protein n=1 Tax=unclassified Azospirillum TaxID=2630922 RepID=UPI000B765FE3|nr:MULTISPECIES: peptide ABC transporter substrate-binding protein [unclassified Azospirillum]SNR84305.1 oligopeptide transport system substrate-binding protein [Azospirillum sp. RU38E]SNR99957.1 oligopeptide transport system substrate-binding protein [Azospirillum sp. RU37A]